MGWDVSSEARVSAVAQITKRGNIMNGICKCGKVIMDSDLKISLKGVQFCTECAFKELEKESEK